MKPTELQRTVTRIGELVAEIEQVPDVETREKARELVQALLDLHHAGLERILAITRAPIDELATDEAVALLFSLHGLHAATVESRVRAALAELAPRLLEEGVAVELVDVTEERVHVGLKASGTVSAHIAGLRAALEAAVRRSAPEIVAVEIDGLEAPSAPARISVGPPKR